MEKSVKVLISAIIVWRLSVETAGKILDKNAMAKKIVTTACWLSVEMTESTKGKIAILLILRDVMNFVKRSSHNLAFVVMVRLMKDKSVMIKEMQIAWIVWRLSAETTDLTEENSAIARITVRIA